MPDDTNTSADPPTPTTPPTGAHNADLTHLHPDTLRLGGIGVFAGDWAQTQAADGSWRYPIGFVGVLIDTWNGWAVFRCTRDVAEAIVTDQQRLRDLEHARLRAEGLDGGALTARLDETVAPMAFDGDDIVVDDRAAHGGEELSRITPDPDGQYIVNGWDWTWTAVDPAACDRIAGHIPPRGQHQEYVMLTHTPDLRVPHDRLRMTALEELATQNGVAFTAMLCLDGEPVGTVENTGNGGSTTLYSTNTLFGWQRMRDYVAACRYRGQPVSEEQILDALVTEHDLARTLARATAEGGTAVRLLDEHHYTLDLLTIRPAPTSNAERSVLARRLAAQHPHPAGATWQIWSGTAWRYLGPANSNQTAPTPAPRGPAQPQEPTPGP